MPWLKAAFSHVARWRPYPGGFPYLHHQRQKLSPGGRSEICRLGRSPQWEPLQNGGKPTANGWSLSWAAGQLSWSCHRRPPLHPKHWLVALGHRPRVLRLGPPSQLLVLGVPPRSWAPRRTACTVSQGCLWLLARPVCLFCISDRNEQASLPEIILPLVTYPTDNWKMRDGLQIQEEETHLKKKKHKNRSLKRSIWTLAFIIGCLKLGGA